MRGLKLLLHAADECRVCSPIGRVSPSIYSAVMQEAARMRRASESEALWHAYTSDACLEDLVLKLLASLVQK